MGCRFAIRLIILSVENPYSLETLDIGDNSECLSTAKLKIPEQHVAFLNRQAYNMAFSQDAQCFRRRPSG